MPPAPNAMSFVPPALDDEARNTTPTVSVLALNVGDVLEELSFWPLVMANPSFTPLNTTAAWPPMRFARYFGNAGMPTPWEMLFVKAFVRVPSDEIDCHSSTVSPSESARSSALKAMNGTGARPPELASTPSATVVVPVQAQTSGSTSVPAPVFVRDAAPDIIPSCSIFTPPSTQISRSPSIATATVFEWEANAR